MAASAPGTGIVKAHTVLTVAAVILLFSMSGFAGTLKGSVVNGTTGKRAAGAQVALLSPSSSGMEEIARTSSDAAGNFQLQVAETQDLTLLRVAHQAVTYYKIVEPGTGEVELRFYEVESKGLDGVVAGMDVQRYQSQGDTLVVSELIVLRNASAPPRTLVNDRSFEIYLPEDATVERAGVQSGNGQPLPASPLPGDKKGHYYFHFPIRPGETRLQINYRLPYKGEKMITAKAAWPLEYFFVALPKSMKFAANESGVFKPRPDKTDVNVQVTTQLKPGQEVAFRVSGTGTLPATQSSAEQQQAAARPANRPGGGLGIPINQPDPMHNLRWHILTALCLALAGGGVYVTRRSALASARAGARLSAHVALVRSVGTSSPATGSRKARRKNLMKRREQVRQQTTAGTGQRKAG